MSPEQPSISNPSPKPLLGRGPKPGFRTGSQTGFSDGVRTEVSEIFSSIQGEGPYLGVRQIFIRFGRCNMHCVYCDELDKMKPGGYRDVSLREVLGEVDRLNVGSGHHSVSLTGGEPLMYAPFLEALLPELRKRGFKIYLETNGTYPRFLEKHLDHIDIVAMDLKPPSSTHDRSFWDEHRAFLRIASRKHVFVKVVVTEGTTFEDLDHCLRLVGEVDRAIPFVFQPESELVGIRMQALAKIREFLTARQSATGGSAVGGKDGAPSARPLELEDIRIIPQMHKIWGVR